MLKKNKKGKSKLGKSVRARGNAYERKIAKDLKNIGFKRACTSRAESRNTDAKKIDICYSDPLNIQCKCRNNFKSPIEDLKAMPVDSNYNIVLQKIVGSGEYAILTKNDLFYLLEIMKVEGII